MRLNTTQKIIQFNITFHHVYVGNQIVLIKSDGVTVRRTDQLYYTDGAIEDLNGYQVVKVAAFEYLLLMACIKPTDATRQLYFFCANTDDNYYGFFIDFALSVYPVGFAQWPLLPLEVSDNNVVIPIWEGDVLKSTVISQWSHIKVVDNLLIAPCITLHEFGLCFTEVVVVRGRVQTERVHFRTRRGMWSIETEFTIIDMKFVGDVLWMLGTDSGRTRIFQYAAYSQPTDAVIIGVNHHEIPSESRNVMVNADTTRYPLWNAHATDRSRLQVFEKYVAVVDHSDHTIEYHNSDLVLLSRSLISIYRDRELIVSFSVNNFMGMSIVPRLSRVNVLRYDLSMDRVPQLVFTVDVMRRYKPDDALIHPAVAHVAVENRLPAGPARVILGFLIPVPERQVVDANPEADRRHFVNRHAEVDLLLEYMNNENGKLALAPNVFTSGVLRDWLNN